MSLREKLRGLKEDYQTVKQARESGELEEEIKRGEQQKKERGLTFKEEIVLKGLKLLRKKPIRKQRKRKGRKVKRR